MTFNTLQRTILVLFMTTTLGHLFAQAPDVLWKKQIGSSLFDFVYELKSAGNNQYIMVGASRGFDHDFSLNHGMAGKTDLYLSKLDASGNIIWLRSYGGSNDEIAHSATPTSDGGYIIAGASKSNDGDVTINAGDFDFWIVKVDSNGYLQWQKSFGGSGSDIPYFIIETNDGNYVATGLSASSNGTVIGAHGSDDIWTIKLDPSGNLIWQSTIGGTGSDISSTIIQTNDNGFILVGATGSSNGDVSFSHGDSDYWVVKLDSLGAIEWEKTYGGSNWEYPLELRQTHDNNYIMTGVTLSTNGDVTGTTSNSSTNAWVVKIDTIGNIIWENALGGSAGETPYTIEETIDHGYIMVSSSWSNDGDLTNNQGVEDYWITKLDSAGNLTWQKSLGGTGTDKARGVVQTNDGGYLVAGFAQSNGGDFPNNYAGNTTSADIWLVKFAPINANPTITNVPCRNEATGQIQLAPNSGVAPYSFVWDNGSTGSARTGLAVGAYSVTITDAYQHTITNSFTLTQPATTVSASASSTAVNCFNGNNGSISLSTIGGSPTYTYQWNDGISTPNRTGLAAGNYIVTVTDSHACTTTAQASVAQPDSFVLGANISNPRCHASANGSITPNPSGGTAPYSYAWNGGISTPDRTLLAAGVYTLTVTDANTCVSSYTFSLTQPATLQATVSSIPASQGNSDGSALIVASGGTPPYTYIWSNGTTNSTLSNVPVGTYIVTTTDANACGITSTVTVSIAIGTEQINDNSHLFLLYPNPTQDLFTLSFTDLSLVQDAQIIIYNSLGQILFSQAVTSDKLTIDLSNQVSGLYWVQLKTKENVILTKPIMKL